MAAEGWCARCSLCRPPCVNGAATGWPRKACSAQNGLTRSSRQWGRDRMAAEGGARRAELQRPHEASMGPRPDGRGRWRTGPDSSARPASVNGAATGWPRKARTRGERPPGARASMGPRPDGRGRRTGPAARRQAASSVNGAATGWPRKERAEFVTDAAVPRVNGAATGWPRKVEPASRGRRGHRARVNGAATGWPRKGVCCGRPGI